MVPRVCRFIGYLRVDEGEAMGFHEHLSWIKSIGPQEVIFHFGSKIIFDVLLSPSKSSLEMKVIITSCQALFSKSSLFSFNLVRRMVNSGYSKFL